MPTPLANMLREAWQDMDRATASLPSHDAERRVGTASPIGWSVAHVTNHLDGYVNVRFRGEEPHPFIGQYQLRFGARGESGKWSEVQEAVAEVREQAWAYLELLTESELRKEVPYEGSISVLRQRGVISVRYGLTRIVLHHYFHLGEIVAVRNALGHDVGEYPGMLEACL